MKSGISIKIQKMGTAHTWLTEFLGEANIAKCVFQINKYLNEKQYAHSSVSMIQIIHPILDFKNTLH